TSRRQQNQPVFVAVSNDLLRFFLGRLAEFARPHQLDCTHRTETADVADRRKAVFPLSRAFLKTLADLFRPLRKPLAFHRLNRRKRRRARNGLASESAAESADSRRVHYLGAAGDGSKGQSPSDDFAAIRMSGVIP